MVITLQGIITAGGAIGAIIALGKIYNSFYDLIKHQKDQDKTIAELKANDTAVMSALLGVLDGLIEQGCNGAVHKARDELQKHILGGKNHE